MLKDSRVKINEPGHNGFTPLFWAASRGHLDVIKWWITSGREMDLGQPGNWRTDAIGVTKNPHRKQNEPEKEFDQRKRLYAEMASLLVRFKANPSQTRSEVRNELGIIGQYYLFIFPLLDCNDESRLILFFTSP